MWDLPRPGLEPVSPALGGGFLTTAPPGKPRPSFELHLHPLLPYDFGQVLKLGPYVCDYGRIEDQWVGRSIKKFLKKKFSLDSWSPTTEKYPETFRVGLSSYICIGIPFSKVHFMPLHFYEKHTLVPVFTKQKSEEDFCFYKIRRKAKIAFSICFAVSRCNRGGMRPEQQEWHFQAPSLGTTLSLSASSHHALNCVCEHQCFISIYFVHPLARCVLR